MYRVLALALGILLTGAPTICMVLRMSTAVDGTVMTAGPNCDHQQSAGADHPRDPAPNPRGRSVPGRSVGADAGRCKAPPHRSHQVG